MKRPLNIGHRGARDLAPENTVAGLLAGISAGADGVEFDVQCTKDGHLVLFHDDTLTRITGVRGLLVKCTLAQLRELNAGGYFGPQYAGELIPTLDEAIERLPAGCFLNIEAKRKKLLSDGLERGIAEAVRRHNLYDRVIVSSFNPVALWRIGRIDRRIPLGLLYETGMPFLMDTGWPRQMLRLAALHPSWGLVTPEFVAAVQEALSGLEKINVTGDEIKKALLQGGSPATPDDLRKRFEMFLNDRCKGKDTTKLRFVVE